jgi:hypothetical protein
MDYDRFLKSPVFLNFFSILPSRSYNPVEAPILPGGT